MFICPKAIQTLQDVVRKDCISDLLDYKAYTTDVTVKDQLDGSEYKAWKVTNVALKERVNDECKARRYNRQKVKRA